MSGTMTLDATPRSVFGKEQTKKLRRQGWVPGVIYGTGGQPEHVSVPSHDLDVLLKRAHGQTVLVELLIKDANGAVRKENIFMREIQRDPVTMKPVHVDLLRVDLAKPVVVNVRVVPVGMPRGAQLGGLLEAVQRTVAIRCLPAQVPSLLQVDVTEIAIGRSLHVSEVPWPAGLEVVSSGENVLFTVLGKREEEVAAPVAAEGAEAAEPELIGKKKKEEEEEEEGEEKGKEKAKEKGKGEK